MPLSPGGGAGPVPYRVLNVGVNGIGTDMGARQWHVFMQFVGRTGGGTERASGVITVIIIAGRLVDVNAGYKS